VAEALTKEPESIVLVEPFGRLIDYVMINAEDPSLYSFLPETEELLRLQAGDAVKIGLNPPDLHDDLGLHPEHFWVEIVERRGRSGFVGKVQNDLQPHFNLKHGALLVFCSHHIRAISGSTKLVRHD
jgi:hypothetical protein